MRLIDFSFFFFSSGSFAASVLSGDGNRNLLMPFGLAEGNQVKHHEFYCSWRWKSEAQLNCQIIATAVWETWM